METWHLLHPIERDNAWKTHQRHHGCNDNDILLQWQQLLRSKLKSEHILTLQQHYRHASRNHHQPSLYHYQTLSRELQEIVQVLHIVHARQRQEAVLSPRFDYLTKEYLEHYR